MSRIDLDCRGIPCPQPIIRLRKLLDSDAPREVRVIVDNEAAFENVNRFFGSKGYTVNGEADNGLWLVTGRRGTPGAAQEPREPGAECTLARPAEELKTLILVTSPVFGSGDDALGARLMRNFLMTLPELGRSLWRLILLNGGVTLATADSPVIEELLTLERSGVSILVCGACLEHYRLMDKKAVGQTTNMLDVVTSVQLAEKVLRV